MGLTRLSHFLNCYYDKFVFKGIDYRCSAVWNRERDNVIAFEFTPKNSSDIEKHEQLLKFIPVEVVTELVYSNAEQFLALFENFDAYPVSMTKTRNFEVLYGRRK